MMNFYNSIVIHLFRTRIILIFLVHDKKGADTFPADFADFPNFIFKNRRESAQKSAKSAGKCITTFFVMYRETIHKKTRIV
jgi:hypothetical protein